jgi:hypothetical protein
MLVTSSISRSWKKWSSNSPEISRTCHTSHLQRCPVRLSAKILSQRRISSSKLMFPPLVFWQMWWEAVIRVSLQQKEPSFYFCGRVATLILSRIESIQVLTPAYSHM